jgi:geranylgeranyl diphosphate synthase type I
MLKSDASIRSSSPSLSELVELCCLASGGERCYSEKCAAAWNVLYMALSILDGVEDGDVRDASWSVWGSGPAINISTGLIASAGVLLSTLEQAGVRTDVAQAIRIDFFQTLLRMSAGQHADLTLAEPTLEQCWQIAEAKSGYLFRLACQTGARVAGVELLRVDRLGLFGQILGVLIQIGDDVADLWPQQGTSSDLTASRWTLPVAYAMTVLPTPERERLQDLLGATPDNPEAEAETRSRIITAGAMLYLATEAHRLQQRAHHLLIKAVPDSAARNELLKLLNTCTPFKDS